MQDPKKRRAWDLYVAFQQYYGGRLRFYADLIEHAGSHTTELDIRFWLARYNSAMRNIERSYEQACRQELFSTTTK